MMCSIYKGGDVCMDEEYIKGLVPLSDVQRYIRSIVPDDEFIKVYIDSVPKLTLDETINGIVLIEGRGLGDFYMGDMLLGKTLELQIAIYTKTKSKGRDISKRIQNELDTYNFILESEQQQLDNLSDGRGTDLEVTIVAYKNECYNGVKIN